ncbi:hypothetical protein RND81_09G262400 [Saponaria officinalis]|uniref:Dirigent protein n=1 Tax=Saponaria officinalis TaxID=3572 RepID=A0AAW1IQT3_SAPOF
MTSIVQITTLLLLQLLISTLMISFPFSTQGFGITIEDEAAQQQLLGLNFGKEKLTHFRIYWHDLVSGPTPSAIQVVAPPRKSPTSFGMVRMIDNPLTESPLLSSNLVGRAQGLYASACQKDVGLLMVMNFAFIQGKYNGSGITVLGRNMVMTEVREMPIIGGTGLFRLARGFVQARTHTFDAPSAIVQYHCFVFHY